MVDTEPIVRYSFGASLGFALSMFVVPHGWQYYALVVAWAVSLLFGISMSYLYE